MIRVILIALMATGCSEPPPEHRPQKPDAPAQKLASDSTFYSHTGVVIRSKMWRYTGPDYDRHLFEEDGIPIICADRLLDHDDMTAVCWQEFIEGLPKKRESAGGNDSE